MSAPVFLTCLYLLLCCGSLAKMVHPCKDEEQSPSCVGKFLSKHSNCSTSDLPSDPPDSLAIDPVDIVAPLFNSTGKWHDVELQGIDQAQIKDLFYNKKTKNVVLTTFIPQLLATGNMTLLKGVMGGEPIQTDSALNEVFNNLTLTTIFGYKNIDLSNSTTFANMPGQPIPLGDDDFSKSFDKFSGMSDLTSQLGASGDIFNMESMPYKSSAIAEAVINNMICKF